MLKSDFSEDMGKYSLTEKIYQALRSDILSGAFKDNEELKENTLAKSYGVSRTPVREAIRQLALEGLVDTIPNRGLLCIIFTVRMWRMSMPSVL